jgi:hypothetical protein
MGFCIFEAVPKMEIYLVTPDCFLNTVKLFSTANGLVV